LHFRSKAFHVAFRLSIRLRFVIVTRRPKAFSSEKVNDEADVRPQRGGMRADWVRLTIDVDASQTVTITDSTTCKHCSLHQRPVSPP